jgi:NAD(P)-dependent dehydrogenase (short-subunit alcohol dehydrogenase family)
MRKHEVAVKDKVVIVTGSARGHGRSIAVTFAAQGARLALVDVAPLDQTVADCRAHEADVIAIPTDLRDPEQVRSMIDQVVQRYGRIDVLVNDAGIVTHFRYGEPRWPRIADMEPAFFENVIRTNLIGTFLATKYALPHMEAQGGGHIINFGQGNVGRPLRVTEPGAAVYHVSKLAIRDFTAQVAMEELEHNVCIVAFGPGGPAGEAPEEVRESAAQIDTDLGMKVVLAAEAPMELTGRMVAVRDGKLGLASDELTG